MPAKVLNQDTDHKGYLDLNNHEARNVLLQLLGSDPTGVEGKIIWRSDTHRARVYNGTSWQDLDTGGISSTIVDVKGDLIVGTGADTVARKAAGANNTFLTADSAQSDGLAWRTITAADIQEKIATADLTDWPRAAALDLNGQKITGMADGSATTDGATFGQLNAILEGKKWKDPVDVASTANLTLSGEQTIDGVTTAASRILVKNQTTQAQNGIYVTGAGAWARAADANTAAELNSATVLVRGGTVGIGDTFTQTATVVTVGTDTVTFTKTGEGNTVYTADGTTLTLTGTQFSIANSGVGVSQLAAAVAGAGLTGGAGAALDVATGFGIEISADAVRIAAAAAGAGLTGGAGSALAVGPGVGITVNADDVAVDTSVVVRKASGALTGGSNSEAKTHSLGTRDIEAFLVNNASPFDRVDVYYEATSTTVVTFYAAAGVNLPAGYRWVVFG